MPQIHVKDYTLSAIDKLKKVYDNSEATNIINLLLETKLGKGMMRRNEELSENQIKELNEDLKRLIKAEPIQYVLGYCWFYDIKLKVTPDVLIPRPETEELALWVAEDWQNKAVSVLDIGTGSGAIALLLAKQLESAKVFALDISLKALQLAKQNAETCQLEITWIQKDILNPANWNAFPKMDVIVSNPPYIPHHEKQFMHDNVLLWEPESALFVPDEQPLLFYTTIVKLAELQLSTGGALYFETHEEHHREVADFAESRGWSRVESRHDMQGKHRMLKLIW